MVFLLSILRNLFRFSTLFAHVSFVIWKLLIQTIRWQCLEGFYIICQISVREIVIFQILVSLKTLVLWRLLYIANQRFCKNLSVQKFMIKSTVFNYLRFCMKYMEILFVFSYKFRLSSLVLWNGAKCKLLWYQTVFLECIQSTKNNYKRIKMWHIVRYCCYSLLFAHKDIWFSL